MSTEPWRRIVVFLILTFALSSIFYWRIIAAVLGLVVYGLVFPRGIPAGTASVFLPTCCD